MTRRTAVRRAAAVAAAVACLVPTAACGTSDGDGHAVATVVVTETAGSPVASSDPVGPASRTEAATTDAALTASFDAMAKTLAAPVGLALVPVGGGAAMTFGDQSPQIAWSTIKVPLAVAAQRKNGPSDAETAAIVASDNAAAESLWASLGSPAEAAAAVTRVLREGGDEHTTVPSRRLRPEFTVFGQTTWRLADAAVFSAHLPCLPDTGRIVSLMRNVAGNQQWGLESVPGRQTAVKGGWGPSVSGGYLVRQIGLLTLRDGRQVGVAMSTQTSAGSMEPGTQVLDGVAQWLSKHLGALPGGRCPS